MDTSDSGENRGSTFRSFGNGSHGLAQNLVDSSRAAYRPHLDDSENDGLSEAPPAKRRRLNQVPSPNGNEDQGHLSTANETEMGAVAEIDTESDAMADDTVTMKRELTIEEEQNDTFSGDEADTKPSNQSSNAARKPKMYFDWLDKKTLVKIFDQLNLFDLLQMADEDTRIAQIVGEEIMPLRVLYIWGISEHYSVRHAFKHFGRFVPEIVIHQSDIQWKKDELSEIEEIFRLIAKRCSDGKLKRLTIGFDMDDKEAYEFRTEMPECFKALESLTIIKFKTSPINFDHCLESLLASCIGLTSLTVNGIKSNGQFLTALNSTRLEELKLDECHLTESTFWLEFIQNEIPSLKSFGWNQLVIDGLELWEEIFVHISTAFRNLDELSFDAVSVSMAKFIAFAKLPQNPLKILHLKCAWRDNHVPVALSELWYLRELHIEIGGNWRPFTPCRSWRSWIRVLPADIEPISWEMAMQHLTELQIIKIRSTDYLNWDIFINMVTNLVNVRRVDFIGYRPMLQKNIKKIVSGSPKMETLKLNVLTKSITPKFYNTLVRDRNLWHRNSPRLCIYMDAISVDTLKKTISDNAEKAKSISIRPLSQLLN